MNIPLSIVVASSLGAVFGFVGSMPLAGPVSIMVVSRGIQGRFRAAFLTGLGAGIAEGLYAGIAFWSFSTFLARLTALRPWFDAVTAIVLLLIGIKFVRWVEDDRNAKRPKEDEGKSFLLGLSVTALNPTILVTWTAATTTLYSTGWVELAPWMAIPFGLGAMAGIGTWFGVLVAITKRYKDNLPRVALRWGVRGIGAILICTGLYFGTVSARHFLHAHESNRANAPAVRVSASRSAVVWRAPRRGPPFTSSSRPAISTGSPKS